MRKILLGNAFKRPRNRDPTLARDADSRVFAYADTGLRKSRQNDEVLRLVEAWRARTGALPAELAADSRLTTCANLARPDAMGIAFLTLRRRTARMVAALLAEPPEAWRRITLTNIGRIYREPRILERRVRIRDYPGEVRQIAITELGHEKPTLLLSNQMDEPASRLVDRYVRRMVIENTIADAIDFFPHGCAVCRRAHAHRSRPQLTLMANTLYRLLAVRLGNGQEVSKARTLFRDFIKASAEIRIEDKQVIVRIGHRANNPFLLNAGHGDMGTGVPWLENRTLRIRFVWPSNFRHAVQHSQENPQNSITSTATAGNRG